MAETGGTVVWNLDADLSGLRGKLAQAKGEVAASAQEIDGITSSLGNAVRSGFSLVGRGISELINLGVGTIKTGALVAGGALGALGGFALKSGADLQATALSMQGLTKSAEVGSKVFSELYQFALKSPFAFPEVAQAGKTLLGLGRNANQVVGDMELLGNVSVTTGASLQTLSEVFGEVSAKGKIGREEINRLVENGVGILPLLQQELGKTAEEVLNMATEGQISFDVFQKAMTNAVDPSIMEKFNNTMPRQISRLVGSLRNIGFAFIGIDISSGFQSKMDGLNQIAITTVKTIADTFRSPEIMTSVAQMGTLLSSAVAPVLQQIAPLIGNIASALLGVVEGAAPGIAALVAGLAPIGQALAGLGTALGGALGTIFANLAPLITSILSLLSPLVTVIGQALGVLMPALTSLINAALPGINVFLGALGDAFVALGPVLNEVATILGQALSDVLTALAPALKPIGEAIAIIAPVLAQMIGLFAKFAAEILTAMAPLLPPLAEALAQIGSSLMSAIQPVLPQIVEGFSQLITALIPILPLIADLVIQLIEGLAPVLPQLVDLWLQLIQAIIPIIPPLIQILSAVLPPLVQIIIWLAQGAINILIASLKPLVQGINMVIQIFVLWWNNVLQAKDIIVNAVSGAVNWVRDKLGELGRLGRYAIEGFVNGIKGAAGMIWDAIQTAISKIPKAIRDFFKLGSPSRLMMGFGQNIMQGMAIGIASEASSVASTAQSASERILNGFSGNTASSLAAPASALGTEFAGASKAVTYKVYQNNSGIVARSRSEWREIVADGIEAVNESLRAKGGDQIPNITGSSTSG